MKKYLKKSLTLGPLALNPSCVLSIVEEIMGPYPGSREGFVDSSTKRDGESTRFS